jgi:L-threonylcarbamoyladenylate synthase
VIHDPLGDAARWVRDGGLLAYPTETVWGLGADAGSEEAVQRLRSWKGRSERAPISILVEDAHMLEGLGFEADAAARRLMSQFWPGPLTLVLPCRRRFASGVARDDGARRLSSEGVGPITSTSLNPSGEPAVCTRREAAVCCDDGPCAPRMLDVEGAEAGGQQVSTVVDLAGGRLEVLRWGGLPERVLAPVLAEIGAP